MPAGNVVVLQPGRRSRIKRQPKVGTMVRVKKNQPTVRSVNKKVKKLQKAIELKHRDVNMANVELVSDPLAANIVLINGLPQGTTSITRIGDEVRTTSIRIRGRIDSVASTLGPVTIRVLLVRDMQPNGATLTATNVLDTNATFIVDAPYNTTYNERFRILYDKTQVLSPQAVTFFTPGTGQTTGFAQVTALVKIKRSVGFMTDYGLGTAGTIADISKNSIYMIFLSNKTNASNEGPFFNGTARIYFKDA